MQRKVAYVFLYKNGIRERSVGIVRRYGTAEQPEVALELYGKEVRNRKWKIYYFTKEEVLTETTYLWGTTKERGRSEVRLSQCRLCTEAGMGGGVVLVPEDGKHETGRGVVSVSEDTKVRDGERRWNPETADLHEYLCARYDGKEVTETELREAFCRKTAPETGENSCIESAKKLMEEIARAAEGEGAEEAAVSVQRDLLPEEELLFLKPPYVPCRRHHVEYSVRITPEDLLFFPKEGKRYAENSFALHGYYRHRHLLLGRRIQKDREEYVLLVPGTYNEKEAGLANLFGFPEFLPVASKMPETGGAVSGNEWFGYFCGKI